MEKPSDWSQRLTKALDEWNRSPDRFGRDYDHLFSKFVCTERVESWDSFCRWSIELQEWGFRGQREASWGLQTSLERDAVHGGIRVSYSYGNTSGVRSLDRKIVGEQLLAHFRRLAPSYLRNLPPDNDLASWLSLMQHYGGPTRLLDWTECPFVAMYFALRNEPRKENDSAVWAIDLGWLERKAQEILGPKGAAQTSHGCLSTPDLVNALLREMQIPLVVRIDPQNRNERMAAQKGFFLWKLYEQMPLFDQMLIDMMLHPGVVESPVVRRLEIGPSLRRSFLERLCREKNIHEASLFPGDDFCEPLRLELRARVDRAKTEFEAELRSIQMSETIHG